MTTSVRAATGCAAAALLMLGACAPFPTFSDVSATPASAEVPGDPLVRGLRQGGYVVYLRHGKTEHAFQDKVDKPEYWKSCDTRNSRTLSDEGRAQMMAIGAHIRAMKIPVSRVESSEYCRAFDSGLLMQLMPVVQNAALNFPDAQRKVGRTDVDMANGMRKLFGTLPAPGSNTILIGHVHGFNPAIHSMFNEIIEGEAVIVKPRPDGTFEIVGGILAENWAKRAP